MISASRRRFGDDGEITEAGADENVRGVIGIIGARL